MNKLIKKVARMIGGITLSILSVLTVVKVADAYTPPQSCSAGSFFSSLNSSGGFTCGAPSSGGSVSTSSAVTVNYYPFWTTTSGGLSGTSSLYQASVNDLTIGSTSDNGIFSIINASSVVVVKIASTTNNANLFQVLSPTGVSPFLGVTSSGIPLFLGTSTVSLGGASLALNACTSTLTIVPMALSTSSDIVNTEAQTQPGTIGQLDYDSYISATGNATSGVTTQVCGLVAAGVTPTATKYNLTIQRVSGM